ncbi:SRPBCC domain-containing protein [Streptomyces sp. NPDC059582]|uniref:SRPBCC family protein n=1 Tax=Streptomyces sp. NPDC059582 TaxID=3346875 RepID=UPI0036A351F7
MSTRHDGYDPGGEDDLTTLRVAQFLAHPPAKVWRALTEPELLAQWLMPGDFRLEVGHRYTMTTLPRPNTDFSGTVQAEVLAYETERMLSVRWRDVSAGPGNSTGSDADWTITWTLEPEGRGTRLFLVHEGFDPDDPAQRMAHKIMGQGWRSSVMRGLERVLAQM